jgi:site-specific DNA recombinase
MKIAAIYARVSSDKQKEENTIFSQTAALKEFADTHEFNVPKEWIFEDDGYSGASLVRPGLEKVRDLAAEGHIQAVLVYSPDRLSRKYAYQVLLTEEFARYGVDTVFVKAPSSATPEDQLLLQFQGMIAEYERAQILERSRRGKRYRAKAGEVGVLSSAPYGYRFIRKSDDVAARFEVIAAEAEIVRLMFEKYTLGDLSIGAVARMLCEKGVPTRRNDPRYGGCCEILPTREPPSSAKHKWLRDRKSHGHCGCQVILDAARQQVVIARVLNGSRFQFHQSLPKKRS